MTESVSAPQTSQGMFGNDDLIQFARRVFEQLGMSEQDAALMADHLLWAERRGIPAIGVRKLIQYTARIRNGGTRADAQPVTLSSRGATVLIDGRDGFGQVMGYHGMHAAIEMARQAGTGTAVVRNTTSAGALGYFAMLAAEHDMIGLAINNSVPLQPVWGGREKFLGNQAFAIGAPAGRHSPLILDMATSAITLARIHEHLDHGTELPAGVALGPDGIPTTDPELALAGILLPMGGHRGSGLALMWEVLTGILAGGPRYSTNVTAPDEHGVAQGVSLFLMAVDPTAMMPLPVFVARMDELIDRIHATTPADGVARVTVPGERSHAEEQRSVVAGVRVPAAIARTLGELGRELGVSPNPFA
jgi:LDH2 family malate/lactate/ureidoglycolate dehydrogenase